ncbi:hypothetical protein GCM10010252_06850 [Streptomyces aureoverticillatus]|nr:hypothetical protein GCM10010252_06850 [Streptomyces aureoverticillatus]
MHAEVYVIGRDHGHARRCGGRDERERLVGYALRPLHGLSAVDVDEVRDAAEQFVVYKRTAHLEFGRCCGHCMSLLIGVVRCLC